MAAVVNNCMPIFKYTKNRPSVETWLHYVNMNLSANNRSIKCVSDFRVEYNRVESILSIRRNAKDWNNIM